MQIVEMNLADLKKSDRNVRKHTEVQLKEYRRSLEQFGQTKPFVVDEEGIILIGNGLYDAMTGLGMTTASVIVKTGLTATQKKKLMMADNRIYSLGIDNLEMINKFLTEMEGDFDIPGYDEDVLRQMVADADEVTSRVVEYGILPQEQIETIRESAERREERMQNRLEQEPVNSAPVITLQPQGNNDTPAPVNPVQTENQETTEVQRYVTCPNCGERIWL